KPVAPKRYYIIGVGCVVSLMLGLALAGVQEARDSSLKNLKDVRAYTNLPVLSSIPLLENSLLVKRKRRLAYVAWSRHHSGRNRRELRSLLPLLHRGLRKIQKRPQNEPNT